MVLVMVMVVQGIIMFFYTTWTGSILVRKFVELLFLMNFYLFVCFCGCLFVCFFPVFFGCLFVQSNRKITAYFGHLQVQKDNNSLQCTNRTYILQSTLSNVQIVHTFYICTLDKLYKQYFNVNFISATTYVTRPLTWKSST